MNMLQKLVSLSNEELVDLYAQMVRINHYDPFDTPPQIKELYDEKISEDDLMAMILARMAK